MKSGLNIAFFGSSLISAYWNGAATYYRGIIRALHGLGHRVTFYEPDAFDRQRHRDIPDPNWAEVVVYSAEGADGVEQALAAAAGADLIIKASGVGVFDEWLEAAVLTFKRPHNLIVFWDVDAPATLSRLTDNPRDPFRELIPEYDFILTYGGGAPVVDAYRARGAKACTPIYNALDPETHFPVAAESRFEGTLGFLGNRLPDREARVNEFFFHAARQLPAHGFLLGGNGWDQNVPALKNVCYLGHVYTSEHNAFNCSPRAVLNINRASMAEYGFSPPTRIFEAAGAGACLITDAWEGIEQFLEPGTEVLVAQHGEAVAEHLRGLSAERAAEIGWAARRRILAEHTYAQRARQWEAVLEGQWKPMGAGRKKQGSSGGQQPAPQPR
jgi:spore maturation protein CgeB